VIYSSKRLQISGPGVTVVELPAASAEYRFRYSGLRLLIHSGGRWFLLPEGWSRSNAATVILLRDDGDTRVDLHP
jgi:hypothetical protein